MVSTCCDTQIPDSHSKLYLTNADGLIFLDKWFSYKHNPASPALDQTADKLVVTATLGTTRLVCRLALW